MQDNHIKKYLSFLNESYTHSIEENKDNDSFVKAVGSRLEVVRQLSSQLNWQSLSSAEKQAARLEWVASFKKRGADTSRKEMIVALYARIKYSLPHILVLNQNNRLGSFLELCQNICDIIDFKGRGFDQLSKSDVAKYIDGAFEGVNNLRHQILTTSVDEVVEASKMIKSFLRLPS